MTNPFRPRILHITRNLPPLVGGMERLNWHIADELSRFADVHLIGPQGSAALKPDEVDVTEVALRPLPRFILASAWQAVLIARRIRPHIILAGSGVLAPAAWMAARTTGARSAVYLHGLDIAVRDVVYRSVWHPAIRDMDIVIANSSPTAELAKAHGVFSEKLRIVHPGVEMTSVSQSLEMTTAFRRKHGLGNARLLLTIGRLTARKGVLEFVVRALPEIVRQAPDAVLCVIGGAPADALHGKAQSRESIQSAADAAGVGKNVRFLGVVTDTELATAYASSTLHVFPVRHLSSDPEGFGMVAIEAAAHGVPTVAFATGGVVDAVASGQSGLLVSPDDYSALSQAVLSVLADDESIWKIKAIEYAKEFAWPIFGEKLYDAL